MSDGSNALSRGLSTERREEAAAVLARGFAGDALSLDEFEDRVAMVWRAATEEELSALVADLPAPIRSPAALPAVGGPASAPSRIRVVLGNHERGGAMELPQRLDVRVVAGNAELDLRHATFTHPVTEIAIDAILGNVEITLPAGISVENHGIALLGSFECRPPGGTARHGALRITGRAVLSAVTIRFG